LGRIGAAVGIKGWVRLISYTDPADNILQFRQFILAPPAAKHGALRQGDPELIEIDESKARGKNFIGHIKGCDNPEQVRQYTGCELLVAKTALPALDEDEYYWFQLESLQVLNLQDEYLGDVHHLMATGANDVLVVRPTEGSIDEQERLIPFIREQVIVEVDLEAKRLRVDWEKDY
jgi:16S rRNA processing protein RimM